MFMLGWGPRWTLVQYKYSTLCRGCQHDLVTAGHKSINPNQHLSNSEGKNRRGHSGAGSSCVLTHTFPSAIRPALKIAMHKIRLQPVEFFSLLFNSCMALIYPFCLTRKKKSLGGLIKSLSSSQLKGRFGQRLQLTHSDSPLCPGQIGRNPGLQAIWEDEKQRRRENNQDSQVETPDSQGEQNNSRKKFFAFMSLGLQRSDVIHALHWPPITFSNSPSCGKYHVYGFKAFQDCLGLFSPSVVCTGSIYFICARHGIAHGAAGQIKEEGKGSLEPAGMMQLSSLFCTHRPLELLKI